MVRVPNLDEQANKKQVKTFIRGANADAKSPDNLEKTSIRLHPDILKAIEEEAQAYGRNFAETLREIIITGMKAKGIEIGRSPRASGI